MSTDNIILDQDKRFSQACIWQAQREYYSEEGTQAWATVPFYITSNPFIANCYANVVASFIEDAIAINEGAINEPFYILELGTGSGQFSFYVLKRLIQLLELPRFEDVKLRYIMSDFTDSNIEAWRKHDALRPFVTSGVLDFAKFDVESDQQINLTEQKTTLKSDDFKNPLIVFANYLFDSVPVDLFSIDKGKLSESLVTLSTGKNNISEQRPKNWKNVKAKYSANAINGNYYEDKILDNILKEYKENIEETKLQFPIGSIRCVQNLQKLSNHKLFVVASDKGYSDLEQLEDLDYQELDSHGSFSMMVNFHAIARYFELAGGDVFLPIPHDSLLTATFMEGMELEELPTLQATLESNLNGFTPIDYFNVQDHMTDSAKRCNLNQLCGYLALSEWDPYIFSQVTERIHEVLDDSDDDTLEYLEHNLPKIIDNFYFVPETEDVYFEVGLIYHELENYDDAAPHYLKSIELFGEDYSPIFNLGICYFNQKKFKEAKAHFEHALKLNSKSKEAKEWLGKAEKKTGN